MALFGWCLPDMPIEQHKKCMKEFEYGTPIPCTCLCHTDLDTFTKEITDRETNANTKKGTKGITNAPKRRGKAPSVEHPKTASTTKSKPSRTKTTTRDGE